MPCSRAAIGRNLRRLHLTGEQKTFHDDQDRPDLQAKRADFDRRMADVEPSRLVFPAGGRVPGAVPGSWRTMTLIPGWRSDGVIAPFVFVGGTDADAFRTYVTEVLAPDLRPGDVVVWDNLTPHADPDAAAAVGVARARVERLPPHRPDTPPIEVLFSKTKKTSGRSGLGRSKR